MASKKKLLTSAVAAAIASLTIAVAATPAAAADSFYTYTGSAPLSSVPLGTVLNTRKLNYEVTLVGIPTTWTVQQLLYRTNNARNEPVVNVTSVILSPVSNGNAISFQSAYDSFNPEDEPSKLFHKNLPLGTDAIDLPLMLLAGYNIIVPDTEGQTADYSVGPEYGMTTLDSVRAAVNSPVTQLSPTSQVALIGYSGGAIATTWAAQLAPSYAPDVNHILIGAAEGGVVVDPAHNLQYVDDSVAWGGSALVLFAGMARGYNFDLTPYLSSYGTTAFTQVQKETLLQILPNYLLLNWQTLFSPNYANDINSIPAYVQYVNQENAGLQPSPTIPIFITEGAGYFMDGNLTLQLGDGVMVAGDVRTLAQQYCASGIPVQYNELPLDHIATGLVWESAILPWLTDRFAGKAAPNNCSQIPAGNSLAAETVH